MSSDPVPATLPASEPEAAEPVPVTAVVPGPGARARSGRRTGVAIVAISIVAILAGGALFLSGWSLGRQVAMTPGTPADEGEMFQPFWDTYRAVTERYAGGDVDRKAIVEGAIKGMIGALDDPYSQYLTSEEFKASLQGISGEFEGIGTTIGTVDAGGATSSCSDLGPACRMVIVAPLKDSPAEKAGLLPGDVVTRIDGVAVDGLTLDQARLKVRGAKGTPVVLTIERDAEAPRDIEIVRAVIVSPEVVSEDLADGSVGYIRLSGFSDHAAEQFDAAVAEDVAAGRKKLIVDLRGNPGGYVTAARDIASQFLADGTVFWEEDADKAFVETVAKPGGAASGGRDRGRRARGRRIRVGVRDRGGCPARPWPGNPRRHQDVRQGHRPAMDPAGGRSRWLPADHREVADARQDLDPRRGDHSRRRGGRAADNALATIQRSTPRSRCSTPAAENRPEFDACAPPQDRVGSFSNERR